MFWWMLVAVIAVSLCAVAIHDLTQTKHAILRNFPIIGHLRYLLESFGPELRQYIVTSNNEEQPFNRDERRWIYASSKSENNLFGFGTDNDLEGTSNYIVIQHAAFAAELPEASGPDAHMHPIPCARVLGAARGRKKAFRPASIVNTSAMSFGSLSAPAVEAINRGAALAGCLQNTGEGGISPHHDHGGELIWQIGTGYFGCRTLDGRFDLEMLAEKVDRYPVRAIEIKLSQGAKPGKGGMLPGAKVNEEIARIRGVPVGQDCISPSTHSAFRNADELLDFVERIADRTGLPVGIKAAVGQLDFWEELADLMESGERGVDYVQIDGGEGGTGAAPLVFADHVALPFKTAFSRVYPIFVRRGLHERVLFVGSGKLGFPEQSLLALALGCDLIAVAREAMLSIGCIQAQKCHTDRCPTGVATQHPWFVRGLDPTRKSIRFANYIATLRNDLMGLALATGEFHPALVGLDRFEILDGRFGSRPAREVFGYEPGWGTLTEAAREEIVQLVTGQPPKAAIA